MPGRREIPPRLKTGTIGKPGPGREQFPAVGAVPWPVPGRQGNPSVLKRVRLEKPAPGGNNLRRVVPRPVPGRQGNPSVLKRVRLEKQPQAGNPPLRARFPGLCQGGEGIPSALNRYGWKNRPRASNPRCGCGSPACARAARKSQRLKTGTIGKPGPGRDQSPAAGAVPRPVPGRQGNPSVLKRVRLEKQPQAGNPPLRARFPGLCQAAGKSQRLKTGMAGKPAPGG